MLKNIMKVLLWTLIFVFDLDLERGLAAVLLVIVMKWDFPLEDGATAIVRVELVPQLLRNQENVFP